MGEIHEIPEGTTDPPAIEPPTVAPPARTDGGQAVLEKSREEIEVPEDAS